MKSENYFKVLCTFKDSTPTTNKQKVVFLEQSLRKKVLVCIKDIGEAYLAIPIVLRSWKKSCILSKY